jgi:hypothetical protein
MPGMRVCVLTGASDDADWLSTISPREWARAAAAPLADDFQAFASVRRRQFRRRERGERGDFPHFPLVRYPKSAASDDVDYLRSAPFFARKSGKLGQKPDAIGIGGFPLGWETGGKFWEVWEVSALVARTQLQTRHAGSPG